MHQTSSLWAQEIKLGNVLCWISGRRYINSFQKTYELKIQKSENITDQIVQYTKAKIFKSGNYLGLLVEKKREMYKDFTAINPR